VLLGKKELDVNDATCEHIKKRIDHKKRKLQAAISKFAKIPVVACTVVIKPSTIPNSS